MHSFIWNKIYLHITICFIYLSFLLRLGNDMLLWLPAYLTVKEHIYGEEKVNLLEDDNAQFSSEFASRSQYPQVFFYFISSYPTYLLQSIYLFIIYLFICLFIHLFICLFICLFIHLFICLFIHLFICQSFYLSVYLFIYQPICLSTNLSIYIFIYISLLFSCILKS